MGAQSAHCRRLVSLYHCRRFFWCTRAVRNCQVTFGSYQQAGITTQPNPQELPARQLDLQLRPRPGLILIAHPWPGTPLLNQCEGD